MPHLIPLQIFGKDTLFIWHFKYEFLKERMYWGNTYKSNVINDVEFTQRRKERNTTPVDFILLTDECIIFLKYFHQRPAKCIIAEQRQSLWLSLLQPSWRAELSSLRRGRSTQPLHCTNQHPWPCPLLGWVAPVVPEGWVRVPQ